MRKAVIIYDGCCNLCNGAVRFIKSRDKRRKFEYEPRESEKAWKLCKDTGINIKKTDTLILIVNNKHFTESAAFLEIIRILGGFWKVFYFLRVMPKPVRDYLYKSIATNRYSIFGKAEECSVSREN